MKVKDLIDILKDYPEDMKIVMENSYYSGIYDDKFIIQELKLNVFKNPDYLLSHKEIMVDIESYRNNYDYYGKPLKIINALTLC